MTTPDMSFAVVRKFRDHTAIIAGIPEEKLKQIAGRLAAASGLRELVSEDFAIKVASETAIELEQYEAIVGPVIAIVNVVDDGGSLEMVLDELVRTKAIDPGARPKLFQFLKEIEPPILRMIKKHDAETPPLKHIPSFRRMRTRCFINAEYENDFTADADPDAYHPRLKRLHPLVHIYLDTDKDRTQSFQFFATRSDCHYIINWLRLALKQLDELESVSKRTP